MANKYNVTSIIDYLQNQKDIDADSYDGSYELLRETIKAYESLKDFSQIDYSDLNTVYLMVIGTWKHGFDKKIETINASHLSDAEKARLLSVLDKIKERVSNREYDNCADSKQPQMGMFGTGFYSFRGKTTEQYAKDYISMCVEISNMHDDNAIFDCAEKVLTNDFKGMGAAAASVVLHCLKPCTFPILNGNMGTDNIFEAAGIKLIRKREIGTYISNCRLIKAFRDKYFDFKNYRVFDMVQWDLDKFYNGKRPVGKVDTNTLQKAITEYKKDFTKIAREENYKWEAVKWFQDNFDIDAANFAGMLKKALQKSDNLLTVKPYYYAQAVIIGIAEHDPELVREMFRNLFDESEPIIDRMMQFEDDAKVYYSFSDGKNTFQKPDTSSVYLFFKYPDKHYIYKSMKFEYCAKYLGYDNIPKAGSFERVQAYYDLVDQIWNYAKDDSELVSLNQSRLNGECYQGSQSHLLADDIAFYISRRYKDVNVEKEDKEYAGFLPSLDEYNPDLTAQQYETVFCNEKLVRKEWLDTVYYLYRMGGEGTCKQIALKYGNTWNHYNSNAVTLAKKVAEEMDCSLYSDSQGQERYWPILFVGKEATGDEGTFIWKLRGPVREAVNMMCEKGYFDSNESFVDYPKNILLYGPPGTGKTYYSIIYAVAIIEGKNVDDVAAEKNEDVKARYDEYLEKGQVAFTTFHQSYGYEEFIEGIKPQMDSNADEGTAEVQYVVDNGVFKKFCENAMTPTHVSTSEIELGFNKTPAVWKVSLEGTGDNPVRRECMEKGHIRIGWDKYGPQITDETDFSENGGRNVLNAFLNKMQIGDIVFSCYSASTIDAIGVITGNYEWHPEYQNYRRVRQVRWLAKGLNYNIVEINGGATMTLATVYKLNVSIADVLGILKEVNGNNVKPEYIQNQNRYVFIIDEINRGNIAKVFGELITLIEKTKRIGQSEELKLVLPYSKKEFGVPNNVYIVGTMNTADRSIALIDTALRRRFKFVEMQPRPEVLSGVEVDGINVTEMLRVMNKRIELLYDREHTIGHSYFMPLVDTPTINCLAEIFRNSIIPLLQEYFFDDYEKIRLVLADNQKAEEHQFITKTQVDVPTLFGDTMEDICVEFHYAIHEDVFEKDPEAYVGIYSK